MHEYKPELITRVETVTPAQAQAWLEKARPNRRLDHNMVKHYRSEMDAGKWRVTHQGIALDWDDCPVDGQHRLHAVVLHGKPVRMLVTRGVDFESSIAAIDQGRVRSGASMFGMMQEQNATAKASLTRWCYVLRTSHNYSNRVSHAMLQETLTALRPQIEKVIEIGVSNGGRQSLRLPAPILAPFVLNMVPFASPTEVMLAQLARGEGLTSGDPILCLRNWYLNNRGATDGSQATAGLLAKTIAAVNASNSQERIGTLKASPSRYAAWCAEVGIGVNSSIMGRIP